MNFNIIYKTLIINHPNSIIYLMKRFRLLLLKLLLFCVLAAGALYAIFLYALPPILSSAKFKNKIDNIVYEKTGIKIVSEQLKIKTYPNLVVQLKADKIGLGINEADLLKAKDFSIDFNLFKLSLQKIDIDYIYIDEAGFRSLLNNKGKNKTSDFKFTILPEIYVKNAEIWVDKGDINSIFITVNDLHQINKDGRTYFTFKADIISDLLRNLISIGRKGCLYLENNSLYADNLQVLIGVSELDINGKITDRTNRNTDLQVTGSKIPVSDIMSSLLYFQKLKEPGKKFIENFYDYSGTMDINLTLNEQGLFGKATANELSANSVLFNVPIKFPNVDFIFNKLEMTAEAEGNLGNEKVFAGVDMTNIGTAEQEVKGIVHSVIGTDFSKKYFPDLRIKGTADTQVNYYIKNKKIDVNYLVKMPKGSDLLYKEAYLGLEDKVKRLLVNTHKDGDKLYIKNYDYAILEGNLVSKIIMGEGLLTKENGHFTPDYITCKTDNDAPVSVAGSFYKYIEGGVFNGDLKYDFKKELLTGIFNIKNSKYKNFDIKSAQVDANDKAVNINANGLYKKSPFECKINALNKIGKQIKIYNMDLFLDEYHVKTGKKANISADEIKSKLKNTARKIDVDVDKWTIKVNLIKRKRVELKNIFVTGSIHKDIFSFNVPQLNFAKGTLNANGCYNYNNNSSDVTVTAKNIDSAVVADVLFELPEQIEGIANATLKAKTKNGFDNINAYAEFSVKQGYLPKLGSTEFMVKKSRLVKKPFKFRISDVVNIDVKNMKALSSDLKGSFYLVDEQIKNVKITSAQKYLSLLIEGDYDIEKQHADLQVLGKYNKDKITKVKILFVPLSWIVKVVFRPEKTKDFYTAKLKEVPDIEAEEAEDISTFRVKLNGNINTNDVKVEMKSIK